MSLQIPSPRPGSPALGQGKRYSRSGVSDIELELDKDPRLSWARSSSASSEYGGGWSAEQVCGKPKVFPKYGDHAGAWAQASRGDGVVTLDLGYTPDPLPAVGILVLETLGTGAVAAITEGPDADGPLLYHCPAKAQGRGARALYIEFDEPRELTEIRLWLDTDAIPNHYNEIDAVALVRAPLGFGSSELSSTGAKPGRPMANVYEMFWDCQFCGTTKLLGKSHRSCPNCGAPQDPARRYFPPESEKVPVADHIYYGVDLICDHCQTANSAIAKHCVGCGAPIGDGDSEAALIEWKARRAKQERQLKWKGRLQGLWQRMMRTRRSKIVSAIAGVAVLALFATLITLFWTRGATVEVVGHHWERTTSVEQFSAVSEGTWCDGMPSDAYSVSRSTQQRGSNQIPDGEECSTVNVDNGDGTYRQEYSCRTRYRSEPIYDEYCDYTVDRWVFSHDEVASGRGRSPPPYWPYVSTSGCASLGCTREGGSRADYIVEYVEVGRRRPKTLECDFEQDRWDATELGTQWSARIRVITGGLVCRRVEPLAP